MSPAPPLPAVPHVQGPLAISVVYPQPDQVIEARDSNFIFGSVGTGDAKLTIDGYPVPVEANGAFLAWLPFPEISRSRYDLVAIAGKDTVRATQHVRIEAPRPPDDTTHEVLPASFPDSGRLIALEAADSTIDDTDRVVVARPVPGGTYKWFLFPGTVVQVTGRAAGYDRVRLDSALDVWVSLNDIRATPQPLLVRLPRRGVGEVRVAPGAKWVDVTLEMTVRPPFMVEEQGHDLVITLYGVQASTNAVHYLPDSVTPRNPLVQMVTWSPVSSDRAQYTIHLAHPAYGYLAMWNGAGFTIRVRRPPAIDPHSPLTGRVIAIDAGHPPIGATGPTGLYEPVPTLAIAMRLRDLLTAHGATVVMTRTTADPVALEARPMIARRANADVLVSIHLNALPDGINPFHANGTGTYFFWPQSAVLAREVQAGMVKEMGLPDLGVFSQNLALARPTWMPAVLCEGAFIIIPIQEAALRTPEFQQRYAEGVAEGLEEYFKTLNDASNASGRDLP